MRAPSSSVVGIAGDIAREAYSKGELGILFMRAGLNQFQPHNPYSKADLISETLAAATRRARKNDFVVQEGLVEFVRLVAEKVGPSNSDEQIDQRTPYWRLREAVRSDGFDLHAEHETVDLGWGRTENRLVRVRILPLEDPRVPLSKEITALEQDFKSRGLTVAIRAYRQAVDSLIDQRFEAANGQVRSMLEATLVHVAVAKGFKSSKQGDGGRAIDYLISQGHLPERDGGEFIRGLWSITHTNGPHPGASDAGEARFRLQALTSAARYLIDRFAP